MAPEKRHENEHRIIRLTNADRILFPEVGVTKGEVLRYYESIAPLLLPYLRWRPVTLERMPSGIDGPRFWQKNTPGHYPEWIPRVELSSKLGKPVHYTLVNDVKALLYLVNQGAITFHAFLSTIDRLDRPDLVLFDIDPGAASFRDAIWVAKKLREVLAEREFDSMVKTSGKSGLHVFVSWNVRGGYEEAREWAMHVAKDVVVSLPKLATVERLKAKRGDRVYIDVIQNARGHHVVPPYTLRATPKATVSMPLEWDELTWRLDPESFNIRSVLKDLRLKLRGRAA